MPGWIPFCDPVVPPPNQPPRQSPYRKSDDDSIEDHPKNSAYQEDAEPVIAVWESNFYHLWTKPKAKLTEFIANMGACLSRGTTQLIENPDGTEEDFHGRFIEDRVLGEGEFGVVKLVYDMRETSPDGPTNTALACKTLRKGVQFKDNTLYAPMKPDILQGEVDMLRKLAGKHFCLELKGIYETPKTILMVTEYCAGGEMQEYVSKQEEDLRTEDVSRISFQMLDAIAHCAKHNIIHRDIKPENVMFQLPTPGSDLRIIDFGSGTAKAVEGAHTTFAGSAFYISPELFQRSYTEKTDVWSVGVTLYVLVAGYPADVLQKAFNMLQKSDRNLKELPNMPEDMPDSYYDMLDGLLAYKYKNRKSAQEMLNHEFVTFHETAFTVEQIAMQAQGEISEQPLSADGSKKKRRTQSISLRGSVSRHTAVLDYQKFERSLTTLLATLIDRKELASLMQSLTERIAPQEEKGSGTEEEKPKIPISQLSKLDVIPIEELKQMLVDRKQDQV